MAIDDWKRRNSYFPGANTQYSQPYGSGAGNAGFGPGQGLLSPDQNPAYQAAIAKGGTYASRRDDFRNKYPQFANPTAQKNLQNFDLTQAYQQGYGAPTPTTQQGPGGTYKVAGGVANPVSQSPFSSLIQGLGLSKPFQNLQNLATGVSFFPNIFRGLQNSGSQYAGNPQEANQPTNFGMPGNFSTPGNQPQNQALQAVQNFQQTGSFFQPRRYFDQ